MDLIISQIRQRLEILYQLVDQLEAGGGGGGTTNYNELGNKPSINGVQLVGNKTASDLSLTTPTDLSRAIGQIFTTDDITIADGGVFPSDRRSDLTAHLPINLNGEMYYFEEESGVDWIYFNSDYSGAYGSISYVRIMKNSYITTFKTFATDTVPTINSDNFITSGGVAAAIGTEIATREGQIEVLEKEIANAAKGVTGNMTLYVNGATGSDSNTGMTSATAFATIEKAIEEGQKYRSTIINVAAGTYTITAGNIEIRGEYSLSIRGAGVESTIIRGRFSVDRGAYVNFMNLAINSTVDSTSNGGIFGFESANIYLNSVAVSASAGPCVNISTGSNLYCVSCSFDGTPSYVVRSASGSRAVVRSSTNLTTKSARADVSGELRLDQCTDMNYSGATQGMIFVDGTQVYPT